MRNTRRTSSLATAAYRYVRTRAINMPQPTDRSTQTGEPAGAAQAGNINDLPSWQRLRVRIQEAVRGLESLREENESLRRRIAELELHVEATSKLPAALASDRDPEELKQTLDSFIETIDRFIQRP